MAKSKIEKLSDNLEKTTKRAPFRVEKDKKYLIKERINSGTPSGLKEFHRSKMGAITRPNQYSPIYNLEN